MKACILCGCSDDCACSLGEGGTCHWIDVDVPLCSRCAANLLALRDHLAAAPTTFAQIFAAPPPWVVDADAGALQRSYEVGTIVLEEIASAVILGINTGIITLDGEDTTALLRAAPPRAPELKHLGTVAGCDVYSPGTFTVGEGWGPLDGTLAAAVSSAAAPSIVVPFTPEPKDPS